MRKCFVVVGLALIAGCQGSSRPSLPKVTLISPDTANHLAARFSPDGSRLFWWTPTGGQFQLWTAAADLTGATALPVKSTIGNVALLWSPNGTEIALPTSATGLATLSVMPAAGGPARTLIESSSFTLPIGWNPDNDRIAYVTLAGGAAGGTFEGRVTSVSHGGSAKLIPGESRPAVGGWSPDGKHVGYITLENGRTTVWVADSDGSHPAQLTTDGFEQLEGDFPFSPDGKELVYVSRRSGTADIWVAPIDGGKPRQLTRDIRDDYSPIWSPDGKWIAFLSTRGRQTDIWVVSAAGGEALRVTDDPEVEQLMQWVAGSNRLAYLTGKGTSTLWSLALSDSVPRQLTPDSVQVGCCSISPDGTRLLFSVQRSSGARDLIQMPVGGGAWQVIGEVTANGALYAWSPDGSRMAFLSERSGTSQVWVDTTGGGAPRQLTSWPEGATNPHWNADGSAIYFISGHDSRLSDVWRVSVNGGEPVRITHNGGVNDIITRRGGLGLYASALSATGGVEPVRIEPNGTLTTLWNRGMAFAQEVLPREDSLVIILSQPGGNFDVRLIPSGGRGEGRLLFSHGESVSDISPDGSEMLFSMPNGATNDLAILNRATGATRRLTASKENESEATFAPDGKTVFFVRSRDVRRIATVDLSKLLAGAKR